MKKTVKILIFTVTILELNGRVFGFCSDSHANLTKTAISNSALSEYLQNQLNIQQGLNEILTLDQSVIPPSERIPSDQFENRISSIVPSNPTVQDLLECGSRLEDIPNPRAKHHFHDPYRNAGLDNKTEHPALALAFSTATYVRYWGDNKFDLTGASTLKRALGSEEPEWEQEYENYFAWPDARDYFYKTLTQESEAAREHYLALTFLSLGHVLHLLEDMGVPPHTRNDFIEAHFRGLYPGGIGNPFEKHVEDETGPSGIPTRWLTGWTPQAKVFSKLADYWDIGDYTGQYVGTSPLSAWGLSEQTNYQFLSKSTIFRKNDGTKYYFPHPDVNQTSEHIDTEVYFWGLIPVDYKYISGYDITHLARTKFVQKYAYMAGIPYPVATVAYHTTFDEAVYEDYAKVTIPRTIDYTTGLINYFFRGRLSATAECVDCNIFELTITNDSINSGVQQTLKGGTFELYWDDASGNRVEVGDFTVDGWGSSSTLAYGASTTGTFTKPEGEVEKYILVYKGNICANPAVPDPDDESVIAMTTITAPLDNCCIDCPCSYTNYCPECFPENETPLKVLVYFEGVRDCSTGELLPINNKYICLTRGAGNPDSLYSWGNTESSFWITWDIDLDNCGLNICVEAWSTANYFTSYYPDTTCERNFNNYWTEDMCEYQDTDGYGGSGTIINPCE